MKAEIETAKRHIVASSMDTPTQQRVCALIDQLATMAGLDAPEPAVPFDPTEPDEIPKGRMS